MNFERIFLTIIISIITFISGNSAIFSPPSENVKEIIKDSPIIIVAAGDTTCNFESESELECQDGKVVLFARKENPDYVLLLGDLQYGGASLDDFQQFFSKTWGSFGEKLKPSPGNHEYETPNAEGYFSYFKDIEPYYSFNEKSWHFISLDSNLITSNELEWLTTDLENNKRPCVLAYWHHPRFSSGYHGDNINTDAMWNLLANHNATIVLNGHDHHYERFAKINGIREFIVGTGGRSLYGVPAIEEGSETRTSDHFGFLKLDLKKDSYSWKFISTDKGVIDEGSSPCTT